MLQCGVRASCGQQHLCRYGTCCSDTEKGWRFLQIPCWLQCGVRAIYGPQHLCRYGRHLLLRSREGYFSSLGVRFHQGSCWLQCGARASCGQQHLAGTAGTCCSRCIYADALQKRPNAGLLCCNQHLGCTAPLLVSLPHFCLPACLTACCCMSACATRCVCSTPTWVE
jgi:hypothetical protein